MVDKNQTIKYFLYARKSSESEERQVASIESQVTELEKLSKQFGLEIVDKFYESKSAKAPNQRPVFSQMMEKIYKGEANGILCWKLDRLARNPVDGGTISWMLQNNVLRHIKAFDREYFPTDNVLMMSVEFGMANQFIRDLSSNTKRGMHSKAGKGVFPSRAPLGYLNDKYQAKGEKKIMIDSVKFPIVRKLWDILLDKKCTLDEIHTIATDKFGLIGVTGRPVPRSVIYRIFTSPFYYGDFFWAGKLWTGTHQPMVTKEEFDEVQLILKGRSKPSVRKHYFSFTGMIRCGECGGMITAENKTKRQKNGNVHHYTFYRCTKRKGTSCEQKCIRQEALSDQIEEILKNIEIPHTFTEWALNVIKEDNQKESTSRDNLLKKFQLDYSNHLLKLDRIKEMRINGEISSDEFNSEKTKILTAKEHTQKLINELDVDINKRVAKLEEKLNFAETAVKRFTEGPEARRYILQNLGCNFILKDKKLTFTLDNIFSGVRTASKEIQKLNNRLEPVKNGFIKADYDELYSSNPVLGAVVEEVRTIFEKRNDATIYIPDMQSIAVLA